MKERKKFDRKDSRRIHELRRREKGEGRREKGEKKRKKSNGVGTSARE